MGPIGRVRRAGAGRAAAGVLSLFALLALALAIPGEVRAPPPIPMTTTGHAYDAAGNPLTLGTPIRTFIDGVDYSNASRVLDGVGSFDVATAGNWVISGTTPEPTPIKHGANFGETVTYAASDFTASVAVFREVTSWAPDTTVPLDLHLGSPSSTPAPLKIEAVVPQPADGGPQYVLVCNPTSAAESLGDYYLQVDRPGTYFGGNLSLTGGIPETSVERVNLTSALGLIPTGDALKLVYRNPGGSGAPAGGADIVVDRVEYNATVGGTLDWQPGATIMGAAPAPAPGQMLTRDAACTDTNSPSDFSLVPEPGLPVAASPVLSIDAPAEGASIPGGQVYTVRWTMSSNVFAARYLRVWVNVTTGGNSTALLAGTLGNTSVDWLVPPVTGSAQIHVDVVDPLGSHVSATRTVRTTAPQPYSVLIAILLVVVLGAFILGGLWIARRRRGQAGPGLPPHAGPPMTSEAAAPPGAPPPGARTCPRCGHVGAASDPTCPSCGYAFGQSPPNG